MRAPVHLAGSSALALATSMFAVILLTQHSVSLLYDLFAPSVGGVLVGLGTYVGCRWAPPSQRSTRLAGALGVIYLTLGVALTLPRTSHAIKIDLPVADAGTGLTGISLEVVLGLIALFSLVLFPILLARGVAALCGAMSRRGT
jgi:hypothetical protein